MSFRKRIPAVAAGVFLAFAPLAAAQPASALTADEQYLVDAVNAARTAAGLAPLTYSEQLSLIADRHSVDMSNAGSLFHSTDLAGSVGAVYPNWTRIGENVGRGATIEEINAALLASPEHAANIYGDFNLLGVGVYTNPGGVMWVTEVFAKALVDTAPVTEPVVTTEQVVAAPVAAPVVTDPVLAAVDSTSSTAGGHGAKADRTSRAGTKALRSSSSASAMGAARGARGVPRQGPPEWAQNERSGR